MALRAGIAAQIGYAAESAYGTYQAPARFLEFVDEGLTLNVERIESRALRAGSTYQRSDRWVPNKKGAEGPVQHEVSSKGFGLLFKHMLGAVAITTPGGAALTRQHSHTPADLQGLSLTAQVGRPDVNGTVQPFSYLGTKVAEWELSTDVDGLLMLQLTLDAQDETTAQALGAATYPASAALLSFVGATITLAGAAFDVTQITIAGSNGLKRDRYFLRNDTRKKEPVIADVREVTGTLEAEFEGLTAYNRFVNGDVAAITAKWEGPLIEVGQNARVEVTIPAARFDGTTPNVQGPDVLAQSLPFKALDNLTNPVITLDYFTTDVAS